MLPLKALRRGRLHLCLFAACLLWTGTSAGSVCKRTKANCYEADCTETTSCEHGLCDAEGECQCLPCYSGKTCSTYDDKYGPRFATHEDTIIIDATHQGVVYKAVAEDEDLGLTCPLGPGLNTRCPCAAVHYIILESENKDNNIFEIHDSSGQMFLKEGAQPRPGGQYQVEIVAANANETHDSLHVLQMDVQTLTVVVRSDDKLEDLLESKDPFEAATLGSNVEVQAREYELDYGDGTGGEDEEKWKNEEGTEARTERYGGFEEPLEHEGRDSLEPQTLVRRKRETPADDGDTGASELTLIERNPPGGDMKPGMSIDYELVVVLPRLTTAIDLVIELFVMDAVSGVTPFALCDPRVDSIGNQIQDETGAAIAPADVAIDKTINQDYGTFYDHAVLNFGKVKNMDTFNAAATDKEPSTIRVLFTAILIKNTAYTNDTVIVTAGAEYDSERYVWVSQATHSYVMNPPETYIDTVSMSGPTQIAQWAGGTFSVDSIITTPFDTFTVEVYSPNDVHDKFSVTQVFLRGKGSDWACTLPEFDKITYFESVTGRTNHRATFETNLLLMNLSYADLATEGANAAENGLDFGFTIFVHDAEATETFEVGVGVLIGTTKVWTSNHTVTVQAGSSTPAGAAPSSLTVTPLVTDAQSGGAGTFEVRTTVPSGGLLMDCTVTAGAGDTVCGISYGAVGGNIAYLPKLEDVVVYQGATATFSFYVNTTGSALGSDDLVLEVSFAYAAAPQDGSIACSGVTGTLGGLATATPGTQDMTGAAAPLPDDLTWYEGGQAGLELKLTFPAGGVPYQTLLLEAAGDLDVAGWGARICRAEVVSAGAGLPCIQGSRGVINDGFVLQKAKTDSFFEDGVVLDMGPSCGAARTTPVPADYEAVVKVYYEMPIGQALFSATSSFNVSAGINMNNDLIWTSWEAFTLAAPPSAPPTPAAVLSVKPLAPTVVTNGLVVGQPFLMEVSFKTFRQTTGAYRIKAEVASGSTASMAICKILILHIGSSYPCVDPEPYFKENEPYQHTKITHDPTNWGLSAILDLGVITNIGSGTSYPGAIADDDAIVVGVMVKGITDGTSETINVILEDTGVLGTPVPLAFTVGSALVPNLNAQVSVDGADGTPDAYDGIMKMVDFKITAPEGYSQEAKFTVKHTSADIKLCFVAVYKVGKNLPCLIPSLTTSAWLLDEDAAQTIELNLLQVCQYTISDNATENEVIVRAGVQFIATADTSAVVSGFLTEGATAGAEVPFAMSFSVSAVYNIGNVSSMGFNLELLDNTTTTVTPGLRLHVGIVLTLPKEVTVPVELGVMTPSDGGRAYATVHGFRFVNDTAYGRNLGCLLPAENYDMLLTQNSSLSLPMIHASQTDTMVVDLKYITNTGITHMYGTDVVQDDQIWIEADILVADHPNVTSGDVISVTFAIKAGDLIFVIDYPLTVDKTGPFAPEIITELFLADDPSPSPLVEDQQVALTARLSHEMNVSSEEANNAILRVFLPKYVSWVNLSDTWTPNITGNLTTNHYIDFDFDYLFFTDILEVNFTVTIDPDKILPKGLGLVNATTILRLACETNSLPGTMKYCGNTSFVQYQIDGSDCNSPLGLDAMDACQLSASTAIDAAASADKAKPGAAGAWSPAVRTGPDWEHYITVDFRRKTRVTEVQLVAVAGMRKVTKFKMQFSHSGHFFVDSCQIDIAVPADLLAKLPGECRFEARYARLVVLEADGAEDAPIGLKFEMNGCYLDAEEDTCNAALQTVLTDQPVGWRHVALDTALGILYFCDLNPKRKEVLCYSSGDGASWTALPSYIGHLVGYDAATAMMYAMDKKNRAMVSSADGVNWAIVDDALAATIPSVVTAAVAVPGKGSAALTPVIIGSWTADFNGLMYGGAYKAKWSSCCS